MRSTVIPAWLLTFAGCAVSTSALDAQEAVITVGQHVRVTGEESAFPHFEPHLAVNPTDADNMIAASMALTGAGARLSIRAYATFDGGETWSHQPIDSHEVGGGDPWLDFSSDGTAYLVHLPGLVRSSTDDGRTWSTPAELPKGEAAADRRAGAFDYPKLVVDKTGGHAPASIGPLSLLPASIDESPTRLQGGTISFIRAYVTVCPRCSCMCVVSSIQIDLRPNPVDMFTTDDIFTVQ